MKSSKIILSVTLGAGLALAAAGPAMATEPVECHKGVEVEGQCPATEVWWLTPNTESPYDVGVEWDQSLADAAALECGRWYQVDLYWDDRIDELTADGILTNGEDHDGQLAYNSATAVGRDVPWRFVQADACEVIVPPVEPPVVVPPVVTPPVEVIPAAVVAPVETVTAAPAELAYTGIQSDVALTIGIGLAVLGALAIALPRIARRRN